MAKTTLAAGRPGERLRDGDEFYIGVRGKPATTLDELRVKVAEVCDGAAEGQAAETQKDQKDFESGRRIGVSGDAASLLQRTEAGCGTGHPWRTHKSRTRRCHTFVWFWVPRWHGETACRE